MPMMTVVNPHNAKPAAMGSPTYRTFSCSRARSSCVTGRMPKTGMPEPGHGLLVAEVRSDLDVTAVTLEVDGESVGQLTATGRHGVWTG